MSDSHRIVISPGQVGLLARRFRRLEEDSPAAARRLELTTAQVRLNGRDRRFGFGDFHRRRTDVQNHLDAIGREWAEDCRMLQATVEEAAAADAPGLVDRLTEVIEAQPASVRSGAFYDELLAARAEALADASAGSRAASVTLGVYSAAGGSLVDLFEGASVDGGVAVEDAAFALAVDGRLDEAMQLDRALAVARLLVTGGGPVTGSPPAPSHNGAAGRTDLADRVEEFDALVAAGVDIAVAANAMSSGGMPGVGELKALVDRLSSAFAPGGGRVRLTEAERAWLPFSIRMALADGGLVQPREPVSHGWIRSAPADGRFRAFGDELETRIDVIAELGRAGLDRPHHGDTLAGLLAEIVMPSTDGMADLRTHRITADVVGDPANGLDGAFFRVLGAAGSRVLADAVWAEAPFAVGEVATVGTAADILARYGNGMAAADQRGELGFGGGELFSDDGAAWAAGGYLGATITFSRDFALDSAVLLLDAGRHPGSFGLSDPRAMAIDQVARHGAPASAALFDLLGDDFLDDLLWNPESIESGDAVHPIVRLFAPVLDNPALRPGLAADVVIAAGRNHTGDRAPLATGDVIQHAFLSDKYLLAPKEAYRLGGAKSTGHQDLFPSQDDVINAVEIVYASGSGDGLDLFADAVVPHVVFEAWNVEGKAEISEDAIAVYSDIVGTIRVGEFNTRLHEAMVADARVDRAKFVVSAVATALPGLLPLGGAASVGTGAAVSLASGPVADLIEADNAENVWQRDWVEARLLGGHYRNQATWTLLQLGGVDLPVFPPHNYYDVAHVTVFSADGTPSGNLGDWIADMSRLHSELLEEEAVGVDFGG